MREVVDNEFSDYETYAQFKFNLVRGLPNEILNQLCGVWIDVLYVMELIYTFGYASDYHASIIKCLLKDTVILSQF